MRIHAVQLLMTKRHSKETAFFCLPEELPALLGPVLAKRGAQLCVAKEKSGRYHFRRALLPEDLKSVDPQLYTCVATMTGARGLDSLANLVQVWFPVLSDCRLRMGRIAMLVTESELSEEHRKLQEEIYRDARSALMKNFRRVVLGRNSKTGGEHLHKGIFISEQAARAYKDGIVLATLMGDGFVTYHANAG
jgi:hypothetical protein